MSSGNFGDDISWQGKRPRFEINYLSFKIFKMKKVLLLVATVATLGLVSCNNAQVKAEKARQDSLAEVARLDSIARVQADSIQAAIEAAEAAAADTLNQVIEEVAPIQ